MASEAAAAGRTRGREGTATCTARVRHKNATLLRKSAIRLPALNFTGANFPDPFYDQPARNDGPSRAKKMTGQMILAQRGAPASERKRDP
ncbi:MAG: hypothetical protein U1E40_01075 [Amaricoccus sp.]